MGRGRKNRSGICLSMIVKDEASIIARSINSAKPYINSWAIIDTGSTDGTQKIIKSLLKNIPGKLIERPWKNFAHNRNEALKLAVEQNSKYILVLDADDILVVDEKNPNPELTAGGYQLGFALGETIYDRTAIIRADLAWKWAGVVHEVIVCDDQTTIDKLHGWNVKCFTDGNRNSDKNKYLNDIKLLEQARADNPGDTRNVFYLAQSYRDADLLEQSLATYRERIAMDGWDEEVYYSRLQVARILDWLGRWNEALEAYIEAYNARPTRAEPIFSIAKHYRELDQFPIAILFAEKAANIPIPEDVLFVESGIYKWRALDEFAIAAYWVGRYSDALRANQSLLSSNNLPEDQKPRIYENLEFCMNAKHENS